MKNAGGFSAPLIACLFLISFTSKKGAGSSANDAETYQKSYLLNAMNTPKE